LVPTGVTGQLTVDQIKELAQKSNTTLWEKYFVNDEFDEEGEKQSGADFVLVCHLI